MSSMHYTVEHCAIVVLAAGGSSRMGSLKQLLVYQDKSLLQHAVNAAIGTTIRPVIVVTGYNSDVLKKEMAGMNAVVVENEKWQEGISSSLHCGLDAVQKISADVDGIIFMVCDQPYLTTSIINSLLQRQHATGMPIVAARYEDKLGTPALFHKIFFNKLMELKGDAGAGKLIRQHEDQVSSIPFPKGIIDIDTQKDYEELLRQKQLNIDDYN